MKKEIYENLELEVIRFRTEDVITTSEVIPEPTPTPSPETSPEVSPDPTVGRNPGGPYATNRPDPVAPTT